MTYNGYQTYEFTALSKADVHDGNGSYFNCGESFTMPASASVCLGSYDNDGFLSGDCRDQARDHSGQNTIVDGEWVGNQMYAELYHVLHGSDGKYYYLIEIELENSSDEFYTFYGDVPPEGVELTSVQKCNIKGSHLVDYGCLGAGDKEEFGSISGTVFCDTDCDGLSQQVSIMPGENYTIEAEDMWGYGFNTVHGSQASGGQLVRLNCLGGDGQICTDFNGKDGVYDVKIRVQDENDGQSLIKLKVNGHVVEAIRLDADSDGGGSNNGGFSTYVIQDVALNTGDDLTIAAWGDYHEYVRIDKIDLIGEDTTIVTDEPTKAGVTVKLVDAATGDVVAETVTDHDGNYAFDDVPVGNYKIMGVAPDGSEFTIQDAGSDDSIDSDVDANGMSDVISVTAGSTTDIDLGLKDSPFVECDDPNAVKIDFEDFGSVNFEAGTVVSDQYEGVTISAQRASNNTAENDAMVFDSSSPTGGDFDLETSTQGNILIVSEDNDSSDPDDAIGGTIVFEFDNPASVFDLKVIDTEEGGTVTLKDEDGNTIATFALPVVGDGEIDQLVMDVDGVSEMTIVLNGSGAIDDICYVPAQTGSLSGRYFCDVDADDAESSIDPGVGGAIVILVNLDGDEIARTTTENDGTYLFENVVAGDYQVIFQDPDEVAGQVGKEFVAPNAADDAVDSDVEDPATGATGVVSVVAGEETKDVDAGIVDPATASISGRVFCDDNDNSLDDAEDGVANITVVLLNGDGSPTGLTAETGPDGSYTFENLAAGDYIVEFDRADADLEGKVLVTQNVDGDASDDIDSDASEATGQTGVISVAIGETSENNDAGVEDPGTAIIKGRYFCDDDGDGTEIQNGTGLEPGIANATVTLLDGNGGFVASTTTGSNGEYEFTGLDAGTYSVLFATEATGKTFVAPDAGDDDTIDSDVDGNGQTGPITVAIGETSDDNDAGVEDPANSSIAGRVFVDSDDDNDDNNNGDEDGLGGISVMLLENGVVIATVDTNPDGSYLFDNLPAGTYQVMFDTADADLGGRVLVDQDAGASDLSDSDVGADGKTPLIVLGINEDVTDLDAGFEDPDTASVGDLVFFDENDNGVFDGNDTGVDGVDVTLTGAGADGIFGTLDDTTETVTTANGGEYLFDGLAAGDYKITFDESTAGGLVFVTPGVDADDATNNDSDAGMGGMTEVFTLDIGEAERDIDAGLKDPGTASVGNFVFKDNNDNGVFDAGDEAAEGVEVKLFVDTTGDGEADTQVGAAQTTDSNGNYLFTGLNAGTYAVMFGTLAGFGYTTPSAAAPDAANDDSDASLLDGMTDEFVLNIGDEQLNIDAGLVALNQDPEPEPDMLTMCADEIRGVRVLDNDTDPEGETLSVVAIDGQAVDPVFGGQVTTANGTVVTLVTDIFTGATTGLAVDGTNVAAYTALDIDETATEVITYTVQDESGNTAQTTVTVTFKGDANSYDSMVDSFPTNGEYQIASGLQTTPLEDFGYAIRVDGTGDERFDGVVFENAYCLSFLDPADTGSDFATAPVQGGDILSGSDASVFDPSQIGQANGLSAADNLDLVSWIVAQNFEGTGLYSGWEVQLAIWELTDDIEGDDFVGFLPSVDGANVDAIVADAIAMGEGFTFGTMGQVGAIINPNPATPENSQPFIIGYDFEDFDCLCPSDGGLFG